MIHQEPTTVLNGTVISPAPARGPSPPETVSTDWREKLPLMAGTSITLSELQLSDAPTLFLILSTEEVSRFISPPPTTVEGYEKFITWTHRQREAGELVCFGIVPHGMTQPVGIIQVRSLEKGFKTAEWGFGLGSPYWGNGMFVESAEMVLAFAFEQIGVHRLEARSAAHNGRGNGALRKMGGVQEMRLRQSFLKHGTYYDEYLWSILQEEWKTREQAPRPLAS